METHNLLPCICLDPQEMPKITAAMHQRVSVTETKVSPYLSVQAVNKLNTDCFCLLICCISVCVCTHNLTLQTLSYLWMWWKVRVVCLFKATCCCCISTEFICDLRGWAAVSELDWWTNRDDVHKISFWMTNPSVTGSDLCWNICRNKRWRTQPSEEQMKPEEKSFCIMTWTENCVDDSALKHWGFIHVC